jgi:hypothetical protein
LVLTQWLKFSASIAPDELKKGSVKIKKRPKEIRPNTKTKNWLLGVSPPDFIVDEWVPLTFILII